MLRISALGGILALACTLPAQANNCSDTDKVAMEWLDKMSRSTQEVNYHGVVTFERGDNMQVMQVSHSVVNGTASESMTQLTGQGAQVVRVDHPLHCVHPGHQLLRVGETLRADNCGVSAYYKFKVGEGDRVAGRKAVRILIEPRDMYRYGYVMELDSKTGLWLKIQTMGKGRKPLERFQFAKVAFTEENLTNPGADVVHRAKHSDPHTERGSAAMTAGWYLGWLPKGFALADVPANRSNRKTFTDGLAVFSVFIEQLPNKIRAGEGVARTGGTTSYTRGMEMSGQPILVTVIGEVPVNTARMVADSIALVP